MIRLPTVIAIVLGRALVAHGDPLEQPPPTPPVQSTSYVALEPELGGIVGIDQILVLMFSGTWQGPTPDLLYRIGAGAGFPGPDESGGVFQLRAGIERKPRDCGPGCLYAGIDLMFAHSDVEDDGDHSTSAGGLVALRGGLDVGGNVRFRLGLEIDLGVARDHLMSPDLTPHDSTDVVFARGFALTSGVAFLY